MQSRLGITMCAQWRQKGGCFRNTKSSVACEQTKTTNSVRNGGIWASPAILRASPGASPGAGWEPVGWEITNGITNEAGAASTAGSWQTTISPRDLGPHEDQGEQAAASRSRRRRPGLARGISIKFGGMVFNPRPSGSARVPDVQINLHWDGGGCTFTPSWDIR